MVRSMRSDFYRAILYSFLSVFTGLRKNLLLHVISVFTVLICFFVLGAGLHVFFNIRSVLNLSEMRTHVSVYLDQELDTDDIQSFRQSNCTETFISHCSYVTSAQAKEKFSQKNPNLQDTLNVLDENPFPPSVEIEFQKDFKNVDSLKVFSERLKKEKHVIYVDDGGKWVANWLQILNLFDRLTNVLAIAFSFMVAFVISNTIKLLVYARKDEVEILSLVGATRNMIRLPFLIEGTLHGLVGAILAIATVKLAFVAIAQYLHRVWPGFLPEQLVFIPWIAQIMLVFLAGLIGFLGSFLAVGKFLR